jgi:hypothetical protein
MLATIASDEIRVVVAVADGERLLIDPDLLPQALGWEWKPEGLCRADVCVAVHDQERLLVGDKLDVGAVTGALGRLAVIDANAGIVAVGSPQTSRHAAQRDGRAPAFTLSDLDGVGHSLDEWHGSKKLLVAFATW